MATPSNSANSQEPKKSPIPGSTGVPNRVNHFLSVGTKINFGYALALSIAVIGTTVGLVLGQRSYEQARYQMEVADNEGGIVSSLQGALLELQIHRSELRFQLDQLDQSRDFKQITNDILEHTRETKEILSELREFAQTNHAIEINDLLQQHGNAVEAYLNTLETTIAQINPNLESTEQQQVQQFLSEAISSPETLHFYEFIHRLTDAAKTVRQKQADADEAQTQATALQAQIIIVSVGLSIAIAMVLALLTSRAISRPIEELTRVSRQITEEANFDLQAPVTTHDEIGLLAVSFNQLVQRVEQLLQEQETALERERQMQEAKLIQSEKMSSLGQMLAGVAHEINNPVNFIYGNLDHANEYFEDMLKLLQTYEEIDNPPAAIQAQIEDIDLEFIAEDLPKVLKSMQLGAERVRQIVLSLKNFSRLDDTEPHLVNLHDCLSSTLLILDNRIKKGIDVVCNYGDIPEVEGFAGLLYQVFMNLLSNAIDALEEQPSEQDIRQITISTERTDSNHVTVCIRDNGMGIPADIQPQIFEMFFTTKPSGVGTGMGLAISRQIVVEKHFGTLDCYSQAGKGTEFAITLPIKHSCIKAAADSLLLETI